MALNRVGSSQQDYEMIYKYLRDVARAYELSMPVQTQNTPVRKNSFAVTAKQREEMGLLSSQRMRDIDKEKYHDKLTAAYAEGCITKEQYEARQRHVSNAVVTAQCDEVLKDLRDANTAIEAAARKAKEAKQVTETKSKRLLHPSLILSATATATCGIGIVLHATQWVSAWPWVIVAGLLLILSVCVQTMK